MDGLFARFHLDSRGVIGYAENSHRCIAARKRHVDLAKAGTQSMRRVVAPACPFAEAAGVREKRSRYLASRRIRRRRSKPMRREILRRRFAARERVLPQHRCEEPLVRRQTE